MVLFKVWPYLNLVFNVLPPVSVIVLQIIETMKQKAEYICLYEKD